MLFLRVLKEYFLLKVGYTQNEKPTSTFREGLGEESVILIWQ